MKKIQKKARQEGKSKDGDSGDDKKQKLKEEDSSKFCMEVFRFFISPEERRGKGLPP